VEEADGCGGGKDGQQAWWSWTTTLAQEPERTTSGRHAWR
jgi:hypothetical protein